MKQIEDLRDNMVWLLGEAGFTPDLYIVRNHETAISIHFDDEGAVKYFQKEVESSVWAEDVIFDCRRDGKRYVAYIQLW